MVVIFSPVTDSASIRSVATFFRAQELCESRGGLVKVEVAGQGSPSLIASTVSVDVKQH